MTRDNEVILPLIVIGGVILLSTGAVSRFKGWLKGAVQGGVGPATTPDQNSILGKDTAASSAQSAADAAAQAQGGWGSLGGALGSVVHGDFFKPIHSGIGGDTAVAHGPYTVPGVTFGGTAKDGQFTLSGAVSWMTPHGLVTAFDNALSGKSFTYDPNAPGAIPVPSSVAAPVVASIAALPPATVQALQQASIQH